MASVEQCAKVAINSLDYWSNLMGNQYDSTIDSSGLNMLG